MLTLNYLYNIWVIPFVFAIYFEARAMWLVFSFESKFKFKLLRNQLGWVSIEGLQILFNATENPNLKRYVKKLILLKRLFLIFVLLTLGSLIIQRFLYLHHYDFLFRPEV